MKPKRWEIHHDIIARLVIHQRASLVPHGPPFSKRRAGSHRRSARSFIRAQKALNLRGV